MTATGSPSKKDRPRGAGVLVIREGDAEFIRNNNLLYTPAQMAHKLGLGAATVRKYMKENGIFCILDLPASQKINKTIILSR